MRRLLAVLLMLLGSSAAALGQIAVVASTSVLAGTSTPTINTTGATLLVAFCGYSGETISDTYGNTWFTPVTIGNGTVGLGEYSYSYSKSAGALSTGSADALSCGPATDSGTFIALSGTLTTSAVLDGTPVTAAGSSYPFTTGTFSPSQSGDMIVLEAVSGDDNGGPGTTASGFTTQQCQGGTGGAIDVNDVCTFTYLDTGTTPVSSTLTTADTDNATVLLAFKAGAASTNHYGNISDTSTFGDSISASKNGAGASHSAALAASCTVADSVATSVTRSGGSGSSQQLPLVYIVGL